MHPSHLKRGEALWTGQDASWDYVHTCFSIEVILDGNGHECDEVHSPFVSMQQLGECHYDCENQYFKIYKALCRPCLLRRKFFSVSSIHTNLERKKRNQYLQNGAQNTRAHRYRRRDGVCQSSSASHCSYVSSSRHQLELFTDLISLVTVIGLAAYGLVFYQFSGLELNMFTVCDLHKRLSCL